MAALQNGMPRPLKSMQHCEPSPKTLPGSVQPASSLPVNELGSRVQPALLCQCARARVCVPARQLLGCHRCGASKGLTTSGASKGLTTSAHNTACVLRHSTVAPRNLCARSVLDVTRVRLSLTHTHTCRRVSYLDQVHVHGELRQCHCSKLHVYV